MLSALFLLFFLSCGVFIVRMLLPRHSVLTRIWLGLSLGLLLLMWLPALFAFAFGFTQKAHWFAMATVALLTGGSFFVRDRRAARRWDREETKQVILLASTITPLTILGGYLQYTHCLWQDQWGNLCVGQSTYGDLPMHLSFITGLVNSPFPPEYPFCPGVQLSYPFLTDTLSTTCYMFGWSLQASVVIPGTLMMFLCYSGVLCIARGLGNGKKAALLAFLLFFLNGGLGFLYDFDLAGGKDANGVLTIWERLDKILTGYYTTPTNQPDPNNLRWSNVIADLMIPQRTLLGGWCMSLPCFYLLFSIFDPQGHFGITDLAGSKISLIRDEKRALILLGVWAGLLPLVHTHSFLALGLCSFGLLVYDLLSDDVDRLRLLFGYLIFAGITVCIAAPQLLGFTFRQALGEGNGQASFLSFHFNWVNNDGGLKDFYLWFYVKNIGLPVLILILALFEKNKKTHRIFAGALPIILAAELIRFQPNIYDNNKLLYLAWLLCCMIVANWCRTIWHKLKGLNVRIVIAVGAGIVFFLSACLTLWRECVSCSAGIPLWVRYDTAQDGQIEWEAYKNAYVAFGSSSVKAADWVKENTDQDAVFLSGTQHLNAISSLAGRKTVCGPDLWLYYHGIDTSERKWDIADFFTDPDENSDILIKYDVDYIMVTSYERSNYDIDEDLLAELYPIVYSDWETTIYKVPEG